MLFADSTRFSSVALLAALALAVGCSTVPTVEFNAYKNAFDNARLSGEEVLFDYSVAKQEREKIDVDERGEKSNTTSDPFAFDVSGTSSADHGADSVDVRMHAWNVLGKYNDALTVLAQGGSAPEVEATVNGLAGALESFPIAEVSRAAADAVPYTSAAIVVLEILEREIAERRFVRSIHSTRTNILDFLDLLEADARNFFNIRLGLYHHAADPLSDQAPDLADRVDGILKAFAAPSEEGDLTNLIKEINGSLVKLGLDPEDQLDLHPSGSEPFSELAANQLLDIKTEIDRLVGQRTLLEAELIDYRDMLLQYIRMLQQTRVSLNAVCVAIEENRRLDAVSQQLFVEVVRLKQAMAKYKRSR